MIDLSTIQLVIDTLAVIFLFGIILSVGPIMAFVCKSFKEKQ